MKAKMRNSPSVGRKLLDKSRRRKEPKHSKRLEDSQIKWILSPEVTTTPIQSLFLMLKRLRRFSNAYLIRDVVFLWYDNCVR